MTPKQSKVSNTSGIETLLIKNISYTHASVNWHGYLRSLNGTHVKRGLVYFMMQWWWHTGQSFILILPVHVRLSSRHSLCVCKCMYLVICLIGHVDNYLIISCIYYFYVHQRIYVYALYLYIPTSCKLQLHD